MASEVYRLLWVGVYALCVCYAFGLIRVMLPYLLTGRRVRIPGTLCVVLRHGQERVRGRYPPARAGAGSLARGQSGGSVGGDEMPGRGLRCFLFWKHCAVESVSASVIRVRDYTLRETTPSARSPVKPSEMRQPCAHRISSSLGCEPCATQRVIPAVPLRETRNTNR